MVDKLKKGETVGDKTYKAPFLLSRPRALFAAAHESVCGHTRAIHDTAMLLQLSGVETDSPETSAAGPFL
jgi:hypothetical protein